MDSHFPIGQIKVEIIYNFHADKPDGTIDDYDLSVVHYLVKDAL